MYITNIPENENQNIQFQRGNCEFLACAMHEVFGYPSKVLMKITHDTAEPLSNEKLLSMSYDEYGDYADEYDFEDVDTVELIHCFSYFQRGSKTYYVDSHGITNNINDILRNWDITMKDVNDGKYQIVDFQRPEEIKQYHWSTYHDWRGDDNFERETEEYRVKPARAFVERYKDKITMPEIKRRTQNTVREQNER